MINMINVKTDYYNVDDLMAVMVALWNISAVDVVTASLVSTFHSGIQRT